MEEIIMEEISYNHSARRKRADDPKSGLPRGSLEEDKLVIRLTLFRKIAWHLVSSDPITWEQPKRIVHQDIFLSNFSVLKQDLCSNNKDQSSNAKKWMEMVFSETLTSMRVHEDEHDTILQSVFHMVQATISPVDPVVLDVYEICYRFRVDPTRNKFIILANRSSIQGLKQVSLLNEPYCAICLEEDFEQAEPFTRLPCTHHFHVDCIVQCLEINHLCPLCRYPMPTEEDEK